MKSGTTLLISFLSALQLGAAPTDCLFEHYSSADGLSHNYISQILQDSEGYIWISTWYGLNRFDGNRFVNYTVQPGDYSNVSHNRILSMSEDAAGYLWITTYDNSFYRFDSVNEVFTAVPGDISPELAKVRVDKYHCDKAGNVWMALSETGLYKVDSNLVPELFSSMSTNTVGKHVKEIFEDSEGRIYVVSELGLSSIDPETGGQTLITRDNGFSDFVEFGGKLVFSSPKELMIMDRETGKRTHKAFSSREAGPAVAMTVTGTGAGSSLWLGFGNGTVAEVDTAGFTADYHRGDIGRVRYLFPDPEGLLWIATDRTGIYSWNPRKQAFRHYEHSRNVMSY